MKSVSLAVSIFLCSTLSYAQAVGGGATLHAPGPLSTIASLDVQRYMGTWYEIAKYPNWFQKKCVAETKAEYRLQFGGSVQVINRCRRENGDMDEAIGEARQIGPSTSSKLKVRFAPAWLSLLPFVWGDYWVVDLDESYQLVAVTEPKQEFLWVLSRTPKVEPGVYEALLGRLKGQGFDLNRLVLTKQ
jgi:apolipoprotein D and lipocalin family protein